MTTPVDPAAVALMLTQVVLVVAAAPVIVGVMRQTRARLEGRVGGGIGQPWRDLRKLLRKQNITPHGTTTVFTAAPLVALGSAVVLAAVVPVVTTGSALDSSIDLVAVDGLLFIGSVALIVAGLDTGTAFGGMGASREATIAALVEPSILMAVFALSIPAGSANLAAIVEHTRADPVTAVSVTSVLAFAALAVVVLAETGRLPVDNPSTHLELTMVHEAMVLEYSGPRLAQIEAAGAVRLTVLLAMLANLFAPWGIAGPHAGIVGVVVAAAAIAGKLLVLAVALAAGEVFVAKIRLFRVPELLAGSFLLAAVAVSVSYFVAPAAT